jgi:hypothetical protein
MALLDSVGAEPPDARIYHGSLGTSCVTSLIAAPSLESADARVLFAEPGDTLPFVLDETSGPLLVSMADAKESGARIGTSAREGVQTTEEAT